MVNMKSDSADEFGEGREYPYYLEITLDDESLGKLGKSIGDYAIGDEQEMTVITKVVRVSGGDGNDSVSLQITDIDCNESKPEKDDGDIAERMYGGE